MFSFAFFLFAFVATLTNLTLYVFVSSCAAICADSTKIVFVCLVAIVDCGGIWRFTVGSRAKPDSRKCSKFRAAPLPTQILRSTKNNFLRASRDGDFANAIPIGEFSNLIRIGHNPFWSRCPMHLSFRFRFVGMSCARTNSSCCSCVQSSAHNRIIWYSTCCGHCPVNCTTTTLPHTCRHWAHAHLHPCRTFYGANAMLGCRQCDALAVLRDTICDCGSAAVGVCECLCLCPYDAHFILPTFAVRLVHTVTANRTSNAIRFSILVCQLSSICGSENISHIFSSAFRMTMFSLL